MCVHSFHELQTINWHHKMLRIVQSEWPATQTKKNPRNTSKDQKARGPREGTGVSLEHNQLVMANPLVKSVQSDATVVDASRDWSELPRKMVRAFVSLLDCNLDRMNVAAQCTSWRDALGHDMRARQLPWMLVPYRRTCFAASRCDAAGALLLLP
jgi:hypothetical protein